MVEFATEGIVLDKEDVGDYDAKVFLYTRDFGKIQGKVKSLRKITSKLAGHLEPLNMVSVRLISRNINFSNFQIVDALKTGQLPSTTGRMTALRLIKEIAPEGNMDLALWDLLVGGELSAAKVLSLLGFDPTFASCQQCGDKKQLNFLIKNLNYFCAPCLSVASISEKVFVLK
ncbi:MAG: DNA repair protein RecO (recombination protein O) [Parcubacteria group bacterium Gr01-1014_3]|nr:MAG: DNA repair protein RecO (recombination protein O) [Parcubacteria group bacterium Gr01-1014_3]